MAYGLGHNCSHVRLYNILLVTFRGTSSYRAANVAVKPAVLSLLARRRVFVSSCYDVFSNLAFEDWFYQNVDFSDGSSDFLFLWRNKPCIVVGRHQNVWAECCVSRALAAGIEVARRRSGGGTVYHDTGNLNATFFTSRKSYNRKANLEMIANVLQRHCQGKLEVTKRDDIILNNVYKVSGTAAKLGAKASYHHCTLLLNADLNSVRKYLQGSPGIASRATASVRMDIANLADISPHLTCGNTVELLAEAHNKRMNTGKVGFEYIDPTDELKFAGVNSLRSELKSWDWIYGHTPKFSIDRTFAYNVCGLDVLVTIHATVERGCITSASIEPSVCHPHHSHYVSILCRATCNALNGVRFWPDSVAGIAEWSSRIVSNIQAVAVDDDVQRQWTKCIAECFIGLVNGY